MASSADSKLHAIALASGWGSLEFVLDDEDVVRLLRAAIEREGGQVSFAKHHRVNRTYLNMVLNRRSPVGDAVAEALGLHKVYMLQIKPAFRRHGRLKTSTTPPSS